MTAATGLLIYGLVNAGDAGWGSVSTLGTLLAAAAAYGLFLVVEAKTAVPLMDLRTMSRRPVVSGMFLMLVATGLLLGLFFLTSPLLQEVRGYSALKTGLVFLPVALAITAGAQVGAHLLGRVGGRAVAAGSFVVTAIGAALLTQMGESVWTGVLPGFLLAAFGIGPLFVTATSTTLANVPSAEAGVASGVVTTFHEPRRQHRSRRHVDCGGRESGWSGSERYGRLRCRVRRLRHRRGCLWCDSAGARPRRQACRSSGTRPWTRAWTRALRTVSDSGRATEGS